MASPRNIILTGFMGTGKSSVARKLAQRLGWSILDTDQMIEQRAGCTIAKLFRRDGEAAFRDLESAVATELQSMEQCVIATGGGMALSPENREALARAGMVILLTATPETIYERVRRTAHRPLLAREDPLDAIKRLLAERAPAYQTIDLQIATDNRSVREIADEILGFLAIKPENRPR
jgi:shikimate kinase